MKLAWLTPWAPQSAIGRFSALVVAELRAGHGVDVDVWHPAGAGGRTEPAAGRPIDHTTGDALRGYDAVVYNMGNHLGYHGAIYQLSTQVPGIVILHDVVLTHLFLPELLRQTEFAMRRTMGQWYGDEGMREVPSLRADPAAWLWSPGKLDRFPMLQPVLTSAELVITHSAAAARQIEAEFVGDVEVLPLPALHWPDEPGPDAAPAGGRPDLGMLDDRLTVLQAGAVNPNKCVDRVLDAFADDQVRARMQLVIAGHTAPPDLLELTERIAALGLEDTVHVLGSVDDATMQALRQRASVATVLRSPVTEASSAVLVDSMAHGLAPLALRVGHYGEHGDDVVEFLPPEATAEDIARVLRRWALDPAALAGRQRAAQQYAADQHTTRTYAERLLGHLGQRRSAGRRRALARDAAELLLRNGFALDGPVAERVAAQAAQLFQAVPRRGRPS